MATSGTYTFAPTLADLTLNAFSRAGVRQTEIEAPHMETAYMEANLLLADWSNDIPNLWTSEDYTVSVVASDANYVLPARILVVQIAYLTPSGGKDRVLLPLSETEYAGIPDKTIEAVPSAYWFNQQLTPEINLWAVPDVNYTLTLKCLSQFQDATMANGSQPEIPYQWLDAYGWELAARLATHYKPAKAPALFGVAETKFNKAAASNKSRAPTRFLPDLSRYDR